jgi:hypothetical protein
MGFSTGNRDFRALERQRQSLAGIPGILAP